MKKIHIAITSVLFFLSSTTLILAATPAVSTVTDPLAVNATNINDYYITSGSKFEKATGLLNSLPENVTALDKSKNNYYFRMEKQLLNDYFYRVKAYDKVSHALISEFFIAKDDSCAWRIFPDKDATLIYGSADTLFKKIEVRTYPDEIPKGSYGIIRINIPGRLPYDMKIVSLDESIAKVEGKHIVPVAEGTTNLVIDLKLGQSVQTYQLPITAISKQYKKSGHSSGGVHPTIGIGIGWGSGGWHHHGGGIGIGIGMGGWDDYWDD